MLPAKRTMMWILVIGIALMLGVLVTVFIKYREFSENPTKLVEAIPEGADIVLGEIRHTAIKDGRKEWSLKAASANYSDNKKEARFTDVHVVFFLENDREVMVKGQQGRLKTDTNDIEITGNVVVWDDDYELTAEKIRYNHHLQEIDIPVRVDITGRSFDLQADRMTIDLKSETALMNGAVKGHIRGNNKPIL
jgi:LPS export ABC transporter protein LptC